MFKSFDTAGTGRLSKSDFQKFTKALFGEIEDGEKDHMKWAEEIWREIESESQEISFEEFQQILAKQMEGLSVYCAQCDKPLSSKDFKAGESLCKKCRRLKRTKSVVMLRSSNPLVKDKFSHAEK